MPRLNSTTWSVGDAVTAIRLNDLNEDLDDLYTKWNDRGRIQKAASLTALKIDIAAFAYRVWGSSGLYAGATDISVINNATNYIEIDTAGAIQINTTAWTATYARLWIVTAASGSITNIAIWKPDILGGLLWGGSPYNTKTAKSVNTTYQAGSNGGLLVVMEDSTRVADLAVDFYIYSDNNATPTTIVWGFKHSDNTAVRVTATVPILPNMYYNVTSSETDMFIDFYELV